MMLNIFVSLAGLLVASYHDFKSREIPDWIPFILFIGGLTLSVFQGTYFFVWIILVVIYLCGYLLWRFKLWGGGDVKLFLGLAALNPELFFLIGLFFFTNLLIGFAHALQKKSFYPLAPACLFSYTILVIGLCQIRDGLSLVCAY